MKGLRTRMGMMHRHPDALFIHIIPPSSRSPTIIRLCNKCSQGFPTALSQNTQTRRFGTSLPTRASHYDILGVPPTATHPEIRSRFLALSMETHPDRCPPDSDKALFTKRFMRAKTAYEILKDPLLRREYDARIGVQGAGSGVGVNASADFSAWSTASGVPGWYEEGRVRRTGFERWGVREEEEEEEEDEDVGFVAKMRRKMGKMFQSDTLVNEEEEGVTWDTVKVLGGVWVCVGVLGGLAWLWYFESMERDPGELRRRNEAARAAAEWWETPHGDLEALAKAGRRQKGGMVGNWPAAVQPAGREGEAGLQGVGLKAGMSTGRRNVKKVVMEATQGGKDGENALEDTSAGDAKRLDALVTVSAKSGDFEALEAKGGKDSKILGEDATGGEEDGGKRLIIDSKIVGYVNMAAEDSDALLRAYPQNSNKRK